ncbi:hypothetical protein GPJ56_006795 [Histomonas meleagridis]|uniref:uncharacterized protein n=1 Tax=Histomonas meleagridis TaxID=135588 RepID=UPI003559479B|nr:hypothetical protein GPJ56_006795 [Histomonas meleagridis]KAH0800204.1 hypothetical protein GO595_007316 [Histomonas meleagridis]
MRTQRTKERTKQSTVPICKLRGSKPTNLRLSTRGIKMTTTQKQDKTDSQNPPQAQLLAEEYVHNLQQQIYFLDAELRFLRDRAGVDSNDTSVDAAIRRLRRACAMHEEETNKKIKELEQLTQEKQKEIDDIDENKAEEVYDKAVASEANNIEVLKNAFAEVANPIHMHQLQYEHQQKADLFHSTQRENINNDIKEKKSQREAKQNELSKITLKLEDIRNERKSLIDKLKDSIRSKRLLEEESDVLNFYSQQDLTPTNQSLNVIKAQNSRIEAELESARRNRTDLEQQIERLLGKNVHLKAELNDLESKVKYAKNIKEQMTKLYSDKYNQTKDAYEKIKAELITVKEEKKQLKENFRKSNADFDQYLSQINKCQAEQQLIEEEIEFKKEEKLKIDKESEKVQAEIKLLNEEINELNKEMDNLVHSIAEASEKQKRVEVLVEINKNDPRCVLENLPPGLEALLESLNVVTDKLE